MRNAFVLGRMGITPLWSEIDHTVPLQPEKLILQGLLSQCIINILHVLHEDEDHCEDVCLRLVWKDSMCSICSVLHLVVYDPWLHSAKIATGQSTTWSNN